jgi:hypothetical protein
MRLEPRFLLLWQIAGQPVPPDVVDRRIAEVRGWHQRRLIGSRPDQLSF